jgi:FkbM family methyltransferase
MADDSLPISSLPGTMPIDQPTGDTPTLRCVATVNDRLNRLKRIAWLRIAEHHGHPLADLAARVARGYLRAYENSGSYQFEFDGERRVLEILGTAEHRVIFDVGANVGDWSMLCARLMPSAEIHAFEVVPSTASILADRLRFAPRVRVNRFGLSDTNGEARVQVPDVHAHATLIGADEAWDSQLCTVRRGDDYARSLNVGHIDVLKIDTEGADHLVLAGFAGLLKSGDVDVIQFEYGPWAARTRFLLADFHALLESVGFSVGKIYPSCVEFRSYQVEHEDFAGLNFLAVHERLSETIDRLRGD